MIFQVKQTDTNICLNYNKMEYGYMSGNVLDIVPISNLFDF